MKSDKSDKSDKSSKISKGSKSQTTSPAPSVSAVPTVPIGPTEAPVPTDAPVDAPSDFPSFIPSALPSGNPSEGPTILPVDDQGQDVSGDAVVTSNAKSIEQYEAAMISSAARIGGDDARSEERTGECPSDSTDLKYREIDAKNCEWVGSRRIRKRCMKSWPLKEGGDEVLSYYCPSTCLKRNLGPCAPVIEV